ncbi:hypothetical protein NLJ89_g1578 [Agrocybe chaxingu]|uniref:CAP-Gly domain-containing protein n=1 Tax=Agrocybe chaxingu TaxID=84603 RepID=A0A9W8TEY4_9AGAR|nr:hypothetical protein NLJ89_g1578 [Agrocybe chaxingu]
MDEHLPTVAGIWLGVEWDDPARGKHSGSKDGKQYFTCRSPSAGSFIRPTAHLNYGVSFLEALKAKYIEALHGSDNQEKVILGSSQGAIQVEAVSLDKIRKKFARLDYLKEVSLDHADVVRGDAPGSITQTCPTLPANYDALTGAFQKLVEVQLNETLISWPEMQAITASMPVLQVVELGYNRLSRLSDDTSPRSPPNSAVEVFNLDSNLLSDWSHICGSLKEYKALQRVVVTSNLIESIPFPAQPSDPLPGIQYLSLSDNRIGTWAAVDALSCWFPGLKTLTLNGNPLVNGKNVLLFSCRALPDLNYLSGDTEPGKHSRPFTIARIPSLLTLDGAVISSRERTDSELFYMSYINQQGELSEDERRRLHCHWEDLCGKHGRPDKVKKQQTTQDKLSNHLINLQLYPYSEFMQRKGSAFPDIPKATLRVLPTMSLRIFRLKACKTLKLDVRRTNLTCWLRMRNGSLSKLGEEYDSRELDWLGIEDGSQIVYQQM